MAALSCYQPCRSHLAQPARCLDDYEEQTATLSLRRRQFIERCHDVRSGRHGDFIPEVSVKKTRDELAKYAARAAPARRLNVESGWSKVEEVRKKFEGAAAAASYSRSFESPPRRRLADSLFASFKLPRKKEMAAPRSLALQPQQKRKSAVELLAESKAFYVKSETVLDRKQELPLRVSSGLSQAIAAGGCHLVSSGTLDNDACCNPYATTRISSRRAVSAGEGLQNTLRRLLEHADSRENVYSPPYACQKPFTEIRRVKEPYTERDSSRSQHTSGTFSGTSSSGTSASKDKRPLSFGDARVFFPESFVIPRQRASEVVIKNAYSIPSPQSSPHEPRREMSPRGEQLDTISPPAEYAHSAPRYIRSNSHSQPSVREEDGNTNINSHKSLPDLHAQTHGYPERVSVVVGTESIGRSPRRRRHSAHHRTASCSSKGTRSNHSSLMSSCDAFSEHPSPGEENYQSYNSRCGSSFARDSGGSSGHYTQRSAPPLARDNSAPHESLDPRRRYACPRARESSLEQCFVSAPPQFQDGAPSPPPGPLYSSHPRVGIHFQICQAEEVTSPLGTFKRQRCLRYKQRRPRPILRSKSDISDRYRRSDGRSSASAPCEGEDSPDSPSEESRLQVFFDRLGLESRTYDAVIRDEDPDSPVFFSSASTVDSNQLATTDYTVQGPAGAQKPIYRNTEPPSVVERNARIIKWLCQCRKVQMQPPQ
ncbi:uncharacterized protein LOC123706954 isoform X5 [Pieris brassicae]|uniref:uncharacterized protein LOC123706954 isoform X5 n=1 Tax=Pieris brassicae TaxID=7116 RepID=UPI001E65FA45|nr:uncharacterized protein LOC123706954 isoform X5 [Pieris brassicae]